MPVMTTPMNTANFRTLDLNLLRVFDEVMTERSLTRDPRHLLDIEAADLAIGYFPAVFADLTARAQAGESVAFAHQRLYSGEYMCVMRRDHPLAGEPLTLDQYC